MSGALIYLGSRHIFPCAVEAAECERSRSEADECIAQGCEIQAQQRSVARSVPRQAPMLSEFHQGIGPRGPAGQEHKKGVRNGTQLPS